VSKDEFLEHGNATGTQMTAIESPIERVSSDAAATTTARARMDLLDTCQNGKLPIEILLQQQFLELGNATKCQKSVI
jgi:hypothetical protein